MSSTRGALGAAMERGDDRRPEAPGRIGPDLDPGAQLREERRDEQPDLVDAVGRVAPAIDVDQPLEVGAGRPAGRRRRSSAARRARWRWASRAASSGRSSTRSLGRRHLAILPGPCDWSRPACSKARTSTGSSRWSSSRSRSAGAGRWYGQRDPGRHALVHLGAAVPVRDWPDPVAATIGWVRRLRADHGEGRGGVAVHRSSDPGHWIVTFPWIGAERALTLTDAALALAERDVSSSRHAHLTGAQERQVARWAERIAAARATPPNGSAIADRTVPIVSISGTNGKSTVTRLITHILLRAGRQSRDDDLRRGPRRRADGRPGRLDGARRRAPDPRPARHRRRASSRRRAAGSCSAASATNRTTRAC